jgi:hypothetical protein
MHPRAVRRPRWSAAAVVMTLAAAVTALTPMSLAAADPPFVPGEATAISQAVQVAPRTGGLAAAITVGRSIADYRDSLAQASSQTLDLGVIGSTLTVQCDASPPAARPDQLPQPLVAESDRGNDHATKSTAGSGNGGLVAVTGREVVRATTQPRSVASFDGNAVVVPKLVTVSGLHSQSNARLVSHTSRTAIAASRVGEVKLLGGAVVLSGLHWIATQRTGHGHIAHAHFTMQSAVVAGKKLPVKPADLSATTKQINSALSQTGIHIELPTVTHDHGQVAVSPLTIGIDDSKTGNEVVNPILGAIQPVTNAALTALIGVSCKIGSLLSAVDLIMSGVDGTGGLDMNLGGADATSDGKVYGNPFGGGHHPSLGSHHHPSGGHHHPGSTTTTTTTGGGSGQGGSPSTTTSGGGGGTATQASESTSSSASCATTSPANRPGCSRGAGLKVGLIALGLLLAFALSDAVVVRLRREPETTS